MNANIMNKRNKVLGVIPARYASTRFPGKPLADIAGMSMIERVYRQASKAELLDEVVVATDDERIEKAVLNFGGKVVMTAMHHQSGTDRCAETLQKTNGAWDLVVNIQGDEPLIFPGQIDQLVLCLEGSDAGIATLVKLISGDKELHNPNVVKVVIDKNHFALYFSRAAVPYYGSVDSQKWSGAHQYYKHVGIYGYQAATLEQITRLPVSSLEKAESLEQLRWLENGYSIITAITTYDNIAVDAPADLEQVIRLLS